MALTEEERIKLETIAERMCSNCPHRVARGYIYCRCCLHGACFKMELDQVQEVLDARRKLKEDRS